MNQQSWTQLSPDEETRIDLVCDDFEKAWRAGAEPKIEDFLGRVGEELRDHLARELIALEVNLRRDRGETTSPFDLLEIH